MNRTANLLVAGAASVALFGGIGAGIAYADPSDPAPTPSTSTTAAAPKSDKAKSARRSLAAKALHGEATLAGKKHRVVVFQRGTVEKVSGSSVTVKSADDFTGTYAVDDKTRVIVGAKGERKQGSIDDVEVGDRVRVLATKDSDTVTANRIADRGAK